jgi:Spx/MgsR family transcriptional regulator
MPAERRIFYWKPTCTTCRGAREFLRRRGVAVEERDINRTPPSRAFLERHIQAGHFLDYVSRRSPVFRQRPLPSSKREAIDLMVEQPNLIKRPILIDRNRVVFGFDRQAYNAL